MQSDRRRQRGRRSEAPDSDQRVNDAITDLSAYALMLDIERHRLDDRLLELAQVESLAAERRSLMREHDEIAAEISALRHAAGAFRERFS
jgi:hypothetical protein